ncbi:hypothetical protein R1flu_025689 [Riccia fluitans]|uniref:Uncharacterized protein n=1 Tax=Riccia fluitans TaxID=41844 RepID=A0ABD1XYG4_9MARC
MNDVNEPHLCRHVMNNAFPWTLKIASHHHYRVEQIMTRLNLNYQTADTVVRIIHINDVLGALQRVVAMQEFVDDLSRSAEAVTGDMKTSRKKLFVHRSADVVMEKSILIPVMVLSLWSGFFTSTGLKNGSHFSASREEGLSRGSKGSDLLELAITIDSTETERRIVYD